MVRKLKTLWRVTSHLNLLTNKHVGQNLGGKDETFANFISIDESTLKTLTDEQILKLNASGYLALIFGQLFSQENWGRIIGKTLPQVN